MFATNGSLSTITNHLFGEIPGNTTIKSGVTIVSVHPILYLSIIYLSDTLSESLILDFPSPMHGVAMFLHLLKHPVHQFESVYNEMFIAL